MQHNLILEPEPWGLPLSEVLLPQYLDPLGYTSRAVGKWHLGFFKKVYTPTARGFASHFGFWNGYQDYYSHTVQASVSAALWRDRTQNETNRPDKQTVKQFHKLKY
jgi:arylsulfatase A-like enzyme